MKTAWQKTRGLWTRANVPNVLSRIMSVTDPGVRGTLYEAGFGNGPESVTVDAAVTPEVAPSVLRIQELFQ